MKYSKTIPKIAKIYNKWLNRLSADHLLKDIKPVDPEKSEYVFIFNQVQSTFADKLYMLVSHELAGRDIASFFLYKNDQLKHHFPQFRINGYTISNSLTVEQKRFVKQSPRQPLYFDWTIDIENEIIEAEGINFFDLIQSTLRKVQKRYNLVYWDSDNKPVYHESIESCDLLFKYFLLLKEYAAKNKKKIRLVGWEVNYIPNGVFRILCDKLAHDRDIEFIELERGYMSYFGYTIKDSYITCKNLTQSKHEFGWIVSKEEFAAKDHHHIEPDKLFKPVLNVVKKNAPGKTTQKQKQVIHKIERYRSQGKQVFVLFAHLFYDTPVGDKSSSFNGMCEWLTETISAFEGKEDLLLIKPHPAEFQKEFPKKSPNETLFTFLSDTHLADNIVLLEPGSFTFKDLVPFISCGLIWRSSVAMELVFLGIPCIIAGNPYFNILNLNFAKDKEHYFKMVNQAPELQVSEQLKNDVARYLYLLERNHVHIDCISYSRKFKTFYWNRRALKKYIRNSDQNIKTIVEKMLE